MCVVLTKIFTYTRCFFGKNRKKSMKDGCCVYLCGKHHNQSNEGVHFDHKLDIKLKQIMEKRWIEYYDKDIDAFIREYGKNFI